MLRTEQVSTPLDTEVPMHTPFWILLMPLFPRQRYQAMFLVLTDGRLSYFLSPRR
jgi:hypothetical protein